MIALAASNGAKAQVLPNPDLLVPFAPITYNGPVAGFGGTFMFGTLGIAPAPLGVSYRVYDGTAAAPVAFPGGFPVAVPYTVGPLNNPALAPLLLHNGLGRPGVDPAEDDNPQGLAGAPGGPGGRTMHQRRHHLVPANQDLVPWLVDNGQQVSLIVSTVVKVDIEEPPGTEGGVLSIDYITYPIANAPAAVSSVWPTVAAAGAAGGAAANAVAYAPPPPQPYPQVLSDLAPNAFSQFNAAAPNSIAWVAGTQNVGDADQPPPQAPGLLVLADYTVPGAAPMVASTLLESPYSPYADKILVWNDLGGYLPLPQYILVPCRDGVEIYDPALVGVGGELVKVVPAAEGKEICSNVSFFGPSPYDDTPPTAYFIVLERDLGESQAAGGGVNFIVFDLLAGSIAARGTVGANGTMPGLIDAFERPPLDVVRGMNDIAIAPPARDETGGWDPFGIPAATAWFGVWDANTAVQATPLAPAALFGGMVGVENWGLAAYTDSGLGFNAGGPIPAGTNTRYFSPVRDASGALFTAEVPGLADLSYPVPVGEVSTNPIFNPLPGQGVVNQNLVAWYWDNGLDTADPVTGVGTGYGVAVLDVLATWVAGNPAYPGGVLVDGTAAGAYAAAPDRSQETITERPLFGYVNYPYFSILFAQRQCGIETFGAWLPNPPLGPRNVYTPVRYPQTPPPAAPQDEWLYQKRRHTAWNPPSNLHAVINPPVGGPGYPYTFGIDTSGLVQSTEAWNQLFNFQPRTDDWVSYFVNWRFVVFWGLFPFPQGAVYPDWASVRSGPSIFMAGADATTSPPPTQQNAALGPILGYPYYSFNGQTPLWADWLAAGSVNPAYAGFEYRPVLRSHTNTFPIMGPLDNNAWVGIGAQQMLKYSLGVNNIPSSAGYPFAFPGEPSIILAHIDQIDPPPPAPPAAGLSPLLGGPGQFRVNFLHIQANPAAGAGPGFEATYVNNPAIPTDWQLLLPPGEVATTEILAYTAP